MGDSVVSGYVYHFIRPNMLGDVLYPLNVLKSVYPNVYEKHAEKYIGREGLMEVVIPYLDVKWNDVLHLSPISPVKIRQAMLDEGFEVFNKLRYVKIPVEDLSEGSTVLYKYNRRQSLMDSYREGVDISDDFEMFSVDTYNELLECPDAYVQYLKEMKRMGVERPFTHVCIPHILTADSINISSYQIFNL